MTRLQQLFERKKSNVLNIYCTAGYPRLNDTVPVMKALQENGADIIEIGMPYSDPLADGPVIQHSNSIALANGISISKLFDQLNDFRKAITIPVILMGYMNPVLQYGFEKFCADAAKAGVDGLILPDLPQYEFETVYGPVINKYGLDCIFLITPETSGERIRKIDALSNGFLYAVSSSSTTGNSKSPDLQQGYLEKLKQMELRNPVLVGFGIKDRLSFEAACEHTNGAIIGSAFVKAIENCTDVNLATKEFLKSVRG